MAYVSAPSHRAPVMQVACSILFCTLALGWRQAEINRRTALQSRTQLSKQLPVDQEASKRGPDGRCAPCHACSAALASDVAVSLPIGRLRPLSLASWHAQLEMRYSITVHYVFVCTPVTQHALSEVVGRLSAAAQLPEGHTTQILPVRRAAQCSQKNHKCVPSSASALLSTVATGPRLYTEHVVLVAQAS